MSSLVRIGESHARELEDGHQALVQRFERRLRIFSTRAPNARVQSTR
jgi:hypothetical protein